MFDVFLILFGVYEGAVTLSSRQFLAVLGLEVVTEHNYKLKGVENYQYHVNYHVAVVESTEATPQNHTREQVTYA